MQITTREKVLLLGALADMFRQGEAFADAPEIVLPIARNGVDQSGLNWQMRGTSEQNTITTQALVAVKKGENLQLTWKVDKEFYAVPGMLYLTLVGKDTKGSVTVKYVGDSAVYVHPVEEGQYTPPADLLEQCIGQVEEARLHAKGAEESAKKAETEGQKKVDAAAAQADRAQAAADRAECKIDDAQTTNHTAYSGLYADDRYCALFHEKNAVVQGTLLEHYPLNVVSHISTLDKGSAGVSELKLVHCGQNLIDYKNNNQVGDSVQLTEQGFIFRPSKSSNRVIRFWVRLPEKCTVRVSANIAATPPEARNVLLFLTTDWPSGESNARRFDDSFTVTLQKGTTAVAMYVNGEHIDKGYRYDVSDLAVTIDPVNTMETLEYVGKEYTVQLGQTVNEGTYNWTTGELIVTAPVQQTVTLQGQRIEAMAKSNTLYTDIGSTEVTGRADPVETIRCLKERIAALEKKATNL